jgi:hypothetical protein
MKQRTILMKQRFIEMNYFKNKELIFRKNNIKKEKSTKYIFYLQKMLYICTW